MKKYIINAINKTVICAGLVVPSVILVYILVVSLLTYSTLNTFNYVLSGMALALLFLATNTSNVQYTGMKSISSRLKHVVRNMLIGTLVSVSVASVAAVSLVMFKDITIMATVIGTLAVIKNAVIERLLPYRVEAIN